MSRNRWQLGLCPKLHWETYNIPHTPYLDLREASGKIVERTVEKRGLCFFCFLGLSPIKPAHPSVLFGWVRMCCWRGKGNREMKRGALMTYLRSGPKFEVTLLAFASVFHPCMYMYAGVCPWCCFHGICGIYWWIFIKLLSVVHPGTNMELIRFWGQKVKGQISAWPRACQAEACIEFVLALNGVEFPD